MKRVLAIGALLFVLSGCGTVGNFEGELKNATPYGGVKLAVHNVESSKQSDIVLPWLVWPIIVSDVPASAVADTLTLPITAPLTAWRVGTRLWNIVFFYNDFNERQRSNEWREFWFNEQNTTEGTPTSASPSTQQGP